MRRFHPWIFSGAIARTEGSPKEGDVVEVNASDGTFLATGHWSPGSIAVRIFSFVKCNADRDFFLNKIKAAYNYRLVAGIAGRDDTDVWRLIHGEGDGLPGLIVDIYGSVAVLQAHSAGFWHIRSLMAELVTEVLKGRIKAVYDKSEGTLPFTAHLGAVNGYLAGDDPGSSGVVSENGMKFRVDWKTGQKTGFFIDQRDNRELLSKYSTGRNVLNMFGYTGGFSVYAMKNAALVHTVDSSAGAMVLTDENVKMNFGDDARHRAVTADAFSYLGGL